MKADLKKVIFICTGNAVRSQIAEGLMRSLGGDRWSARSAGVHPSSVHPLTVRVMDEIGIDVSRQTSKSVDDFLNERFDYIITVCDHAAAACPVFPGSGKRLHWSVEDPIGGAGSAEERLASFRKIRDEMKRRIEELLRSEDQAGS